MIIIIILTDLEKIISQQRADNETRHHELLT